MVKGLHRVRDAAPDLIIYLTIEIPDKEPVKFLIRRISENKLVASCA